MDWVVHCSKTVPDALLAPRSIAQQSLPSLRGYVSMNNRHALIVDCKITQAVGSGEMDAAKAMTADHPISHNKNHVPTEFTQKRD